MSIFHRLGYFEKVISPVACFGASHRAIHKDDVESRRLMHMVVGPPADTNWVSPWHDILHGWNNKVQMLSDYAGLKSWSVTCIEAVWKFGAYVATLPGPAGFSNGTSDDHGNASDQPTLGKQHCKIFHLERL